MIGITNLRLHNIRSHKDATFEFVETMNAIVGPNGSGKTTIIEALYVLLCGSSFKGTLSEILSYGKQQYKIDLNLRSAQTSHNRSLGFTEADSTTQKKWSIDDKKYARLPIMQRLPVVIFEPDLARLITGGPERRRNYLDSLAAQLDFEAAAAQNRFDRVLKQRNLLLKKLRDSQKKDVSEDLFVWNAQLASLSEIIVNARIKLIKLLQDKINQYYKQLGGHSSVMLTYQSTVAADPLQYGSRMLQFLETSVQRDIAFGHTTFGPHRDDLEVRLADQPATQRASRGEVRTLVIALKLLETSLLSEHYKATNIKPILLLDDVLSELDLVHQEKVLAGFKDHQVFITTTDAHALTPGVHTIGL